MYIVLEKERALKDSWIFFPEKKYSFSRLSEQKGFSEFSCPKNKTVLMAEIPYDQGKSREDNELFEEISGQLEKLGI